MNDELEFTGERFVPGAAGEIWYEHWHRYLFAAPLVAGARVLDVACGEGYGSALLARSAARVTGADLSQDAIAHARQALRGAGERRIQRSRLRRAAVRRGVVRRRRVVRDDRARGEAGGLPRRGAPRAAQRWPLHPVLSQQDRVHRQARRRQRLSRPRALPRRTRGVARAALRACRVVWAAAGLLFGPVAGKWPRDGGDLRGERGYCRHAGGGTHTAAVLHRRRECQRRSARTRPVRACRCSPTATSGSIAITKT